MVIIERTAFIMNTSTIHTKHNLVIENQSKCNVMLQFGQEFRGKFAEVIELGLPSPWNQD
jgi:hypothetical protein